MEPSPVPTSSRSNEVLRDVMDQHQITQAWLADETGFNTSYISRVLDSQYAIPPEIVRALWGQTRDQRVARIALGMGEHVVVTVAPRPCEWCQAQNDAVHHIAHALSLIANAEPNNVEHALLHRVIDAAIESLVTIRKHTVA